MLVLVILLVLVAVAGVAVALAMRSRLAAQRRSTTAAEEQSTQRAAELSTVSEALAEVTREKAAAEERALAAEEATTLTAEQAELAAQRAAAAEAAHLLAEEEARAAAEAQLAAEERLTAAERRASELAAATRAAGGGLDPDLLWALEQARTERTWRLAVAPGPDSESVFTGAADPLIEALQVELDAAREEVGAIVELETDLPAALSPAGSVLALRAAQELLAGVVRRAEESVLHVRADGADVIVSIVAVDEHGEPVVPGPLAVPASADAEVTDGGGVRIRNAIATPVDAERSPD